MLHLYTLERGRVGAVAKGVRKTKSRFGGGSSRSRTSRLMLHQGSGELQTVTGVELVRPHSATREDYYRLSRRPDRRRGDAPPLHRAGGERARLHRARRASSTCSTTHAARRAERAALDPLALSFQLKLLWLSGYLPHLTSCAECGADDVPLVGYSPRAGGGSLRAPARGGRRRSRSARRASRGIESAAREPARGRGVRRARRAREPRRAAGDHGVVRVPRRLPSANLCSA